MHRVNFFGKNCIKILGGWIFCLLGGYGGVKHPALIYPSFPCSFLLQPLGLMQYLDSDEKVSGPTFFISKDNILFL